MRLGLFGMCFESGWEEGFAALKQFKAREGHCDVSQLHIEGTIRLGQWVNRQRNNKNTMSAECRKRLHEIGFNWTPHEQSWEEGFAALTQFKAREGHCYVPLKHLEGTFRLGGWVNAQRNKKNAISAERRQRLDELGFIWNALESEWEEGFVALRQFKVREGHCNVSAKHHEETFRLGQWVTHQRQSKDIMSTERRQRLHDIGFNWDVRGAKWEAGFLALKRFKAREGHCNVPAKHREETFRLGQWVGVQRSTKGAMPPERRQRLDEIGSVWRGKSGPSRKDQSPDEFAPT